MTSKIENIDAGHQQHFGAYVSIPEHPNGHAVIVLQEIFGVTKNIREVADRFAADDYLAYAPDLFWRFEPNIQLSHSKEDIAKAMGYLKLYQDKDGLSDILRTVQHIRSKTGFVGKVAVAGLCLGGKLAYLAATNSIVDAAVSFYGVGIESHLEDAKNLTCPLLLHFGDKDSYVPVEALRNINSTLSQLPLVELHIYPDANHGFYTRGSESNITIARERTCLFLNEALA